MLGVTEALLEFMHSKDWSALTGRSDELSAEHRVLRFDFEDVQVYIPSGTAR